MLTMRGSYGFASDDNIKPLENKQITPTQNAAQILSSCVRLAGHLIVSVVNGETGSKAGREDGLLFFGVISHFFKNQIDRLECITSP